MKLGPVTKLHKRNSATPKKLMMASCQHIMTSPFLIYGQFGAIRKSDFGCMVYDCYTFIN